MSLDTELAQLQQQLPGFRFIRELGRGGMAVVYLALQQSLEREVALKLMKFSGKNQDKSQRRFKYEAKTLARLSHRNIVSVFDILDNPPAMVMEFLPGGSLGERMRQGMQLSDIVSVIVQVASGLHFAHENGIIHRDIKPDNVLFRANGVPVISDFGIAKNEAADESLTDAGQMVGTTGYMSPEQILAKDELDGRSDQYSLGIMLYELLVGVRPFVSKNYIEVVNMHLHRKPDPLPAEFSGFQTIIDRMLAKQREERYPTCREVVHALRRAVELDKRLSGLIFNESAGSSSEQLRQLGFTFTRAFTGTMRGTRTGFAPPTHTSLSADRSREPNDNEDTGEFVIAGGREAGGATIAQLNAMLARRLLSPDDLLAVAGNIAQSSEARASTELRFKLLARIATMVSLAANAHDCRTVGGLIEKIGTLLPGLDGLKDLAASASARMSELEARDRDRRNADAAYRAAVLAIREQRLLPPEEGNAYALLNQAVDLDPEHAQARDLLARLPIAIEAAAARWEERGELGLAMALLSGGLLAFPEHPALASRAAELAGDIRKQEEYRARIQQLAEQTVNGGIDDLAQAVLAVDTLDARLRSEASLEPLDGALHERIGRLLANAAQIDWGPLLEAHLASRLASTLLPRTRARITEVRQSVERLARERTEAEKLRQAQSALAAVLKRVDAESRSALSAWLALDPGLRARAWNELARSGALSRDVGAVLDACDSAARYEATVARLREAGCPLDVLDQHRSGLVARLLGALGNEETALYAAAAGTGPRSLVQILEPWAGLVESLNALGALRETRERATALTQRLCTPGALAGLDQATDRDQQLGALQQAIGRRFPELRDPLDRVAGQLRQRWNNEAQLQRQRAEAEEALQSFLREPRVDRLRRLAVDSLPAAQLRMALAADQDHFVSAIDGLATDTAAGISVAANDTLQTALRQLLRAQPQLAESLAPALGLVESRLAELRDAARMVAALLASNAPYLRDVEARQDLDSLQRQASLLDPAQLRTAVDGWLVRVVGWLRVRGPSAIPAVDAWLRTWPAAFSAAPPRLLQDARDGLLAHLRTQQQQAVEQLLRQLRSPRGKQGPDLAPLLDSLRQQAAAGLLVDALDLLHQSLAPVQRSLRGPDDRGMARRLLGVLDGLLAAELVPADASADWLRGAINDIEARLRAWEPASAPAPPPAPPPAPAPTVELPPVRVPAPSMPAPPPAAIADDIPTVQMRPLRLPTAEPTSAPALRAPASIAPPPSPSAPTLDWPDAPPIAPPAEAPRPPSPAAPTLDLPEPEPAPASAPRSPPPATAPAAERPAPLQLARPATPPSRSPLPWIGAAAAGLAAIGLSVWLLRADPDPTTAPTPAPSLTEASREPVRPPPAAPTPAPAPATPPPVVATPDPRLAQLQQGLEARDAQGLLRGLEALAAAPAELQRDADLRRAADSARERLLEELGRLKTRDAAALTALLPRVERLLPASAELAALKAAPETFDTAAFDQRLAARQLFQPAGRSAWDLLATAPATERAALEARFATRTNEVLQEFAAADVAAAEALLQRIRREATLATRLQAELTRTEAALLDRRIDAQLAALGALRPGAADWGRVLTETNTLRRNATLSPSQRTRLDTAAATALQAELDRRLTAGQGTEAQALLTAAGPLADLPPLAAVKARVATATTAPVVEGVLIADALPWGEVVQIRGADGQPVNLPANRSTPLRLTLPAGDYTVTLRHPNAAGTAEERVTVSDRAIARTSPRFNVVDIDSLLDAGG